MTTGSLTYPGRMEVGTFQEYILCGFGSTGIQSTEYTGDTHRLFRVTDHQVTIRQRTFHFVQCHELGTFGNSLHHNLTTFDLIGIEAVHRLTVCMYNVVGNIDNVIDRTKANQTELVLQPGRTFLHGHSLDGYPGITRTGFGIFHLDVDVHIVVVYLERINRRTFQGSLIAVLNQPGIQVTRYAIM